MGLFRVPTPASTNVPNCTVIAPDGTFLYISYSQIVCMKARDNGEMETVALEAGSKVVGLDCDPDFARTRYVAVSYDDKLVYIWDLDKKAAVFGHSAHVDKAQPQKDRDIFDPIPVCFTLDKKVVSASKNRIVTYCVASNTYKTHTELTRKNHFTVLKASPYNANLISAGTKHGLIVILSLKTMSIIHTMRGHETEIRSLDWIKVPQVPVEEEDLFDVYQQNDINEFGVQKASNRTFDMDEIVTESKPMENMTEEKFDFAEACQALKQDIMSKKEQKPQTEVNYNDVKDHAKKADTDSFSEISDAPSRENDFKSVEDEPSLVVNNTKSDDKSEEDLILLVSSSLEPRVWIWDTQKGCALDKIQLPGGNYRDSTKIRSFTAKWLNPFNIITNDQNGNICLWEIECRADEGKVDIHKAKMEFYSRAVVNIAADTAKQTFWAVSIFYNIYQYTVDSRHPTHEFSCLNSNTYKFAINPVDPNVVAFAGYKKISLLNVSKMNYKYFSFSYMNNKLFSQVLTLAWHPEKENSLAFGTREGQVGLFDSNKLSQSPITMKPFFSKDVYSVTWGKFRQQDGADLAWTLFACGFRGNSAYLAYFPQQGNNKFAATEVKNYQNVTAVQASGPYLAVGSFDGTIHLAELSDSTLTPFYTFKCGTKLISEFAFSNEKLAVASFDQQVTILTLTSKEHIGIQRLEGQTGGVTCVNWNVTDPNTLISTAVDGTLRVWNVKEGKCEAIAKFEREVYAANFISKDKDTIIVGGHDFMVTVFDYKKEKIDFSRKPIKNGQRLPGVTMATANEIDHGSKLKKEKRRNLEIQKQLEKSVETTEVKENGNVTKDLIESMEDLKMDDETADKAPKEAKKPKEKTINLNYSSIFFLTPRELNRDPILLLKRLVTAKDDPETRHQKLFSSDPATVRRLLNEEHSHQIASNAQSVGHLSLPILTMDIKAVILEKISSKTLTEEYIAVAPYISHTFWRNTCLAYAHQCVEQGLVLKAISYFLCCYEENEAIAVLCQSNHFTEAMAIAKMRKSAEDPIFKEITRKWTSYLEYCGNFEAASIVWMTHGNKKEALKVLERRTNPSEELLDVINKLKNEGIDDGLNQTDD
ncbi:protein rigor mortis [Culicoides brevitarsis]|uniref:protein rigor mortis n=1 Tax=Culicoides brevitarsis TaxID=469753 RepID=UPI00307C194B